jgi:hypothetical protein
MGKVQQRRPNDFDDKGLILCAEFSVRTGDNNHNVASLPIIGKGCLQQLLTPLGRHIPGQEAEFTILGDALPRGCRHTQDRENDNPSDKPKEPRAFDHGAKQAEHTDFLLRGMSAHFVPVNQFFQIGTLIALAEMRSYKCHDGGNGLLNFMANGDFLRRR